MYKSLSLFIIRCTSFFICSKQLSWFCSSTPSPDPSYFSLFFISNDTNMLSVIQTKNLGFTFTVCFHDSHPIDQQDLHVLPPNYIFSHPSTFLHLLPHHWGNIFQPAPLCLFLNCPPNLLSTMQPEHVLSIMLLSCLTISQWYPLASLTIPTSLLWFF